MEDWPDSQPQAQAQKRAKGAKTNRFRFESYIDRLSAVELKVGEDEAWDLGSEDVEEDRWYSEGGSLGEGLPGGLGSEAEAEALEQQVREQLSRTAFGESLKHWDGVVRYSEFADLVRTLRPYRHSLVHIIQNLDLIVKELTLRMNECEYPETAEAISSLIGALAKDTRLELLPMLPSILEALSVRLETPVSETSITGRGGVGLYNEKVVQSVFSCTSTLFFYLSSYILRDLTSYLRIYRRWMYHGSSTIRRFSSESIAYALKKSRDQEIIRSLDHIFLFASKEYGLEDSSRTNLLSSWLSDVLVNVVFSINGCISTQGELVLRYLLRYLAFGLQIEPKYLFSREPSGQQDEGVISSFLTAVNDGEKVRNDTFRSSCDSEFRKSSASCLSHILRDLLDHVNDHISETGNLQSFQEVLGTLLSIYLETSERILRILPPSESGSSCDLESTVLGLISSIHMITDTCHYRAAKKSLHSESSAFKKKRFRFSSSLAVLRLVLVTTGNGVLSGLCERPELAPQLALAYMDLASKVVLDGVTLGDPSCIRALASPEFKPVPGDCRFVQALFSAPSPAVRSPSTQSRPWAWLRDMLGGCSLTSQVLPVLDSSLSLLAVFASNPSELCGFMRIIFESQATLLKDFLASESPESDSAAAVRVLDNISGFIHREEESLDTKDLYLRSPEMPGLVLRSCQRLLACRELEPHDLCIILDLLDCFCLPDLCKSSASLDWSFFEELRSDLLKVYKSLFESKLQETRTGILDTFESLESVQTFRLFCVVFSRLGMRQVSLGDFVSRVKFWMYRCDRVPTAPSPRTLGCSVSDISAIPLDYNAELLTVMDSLLRSESGEQLNRSREGGNLGLVRDLEVISLCWVASPLHQVRKKTAVFLSNFFSGLESLPERPDLIQGLRMIVDLEECEASIENERTKIRQIQQICDFVQLKLKRVSSVTDEFLVRLALRSILSQLYLKLSLIWRPCIDGLAKLAKSVQENEEDGRAQSSLLLETLLSATFNQIYYNTYRMENCPKSREEGLSHTDECTLVEWCCKLLTQINFSDRKRYPALLYYQVQLLYWLVQISLELEGNQDQIARLKEEKLIEQFSSENKVQVLDLLASKSQIQRINDLLSVLESVLLNQKDLLWRPDAVVEFLLDKFVLECTPALLQVNHMELQMRLISVMCNYGRDSGDFARYKSMFQGLVSGSSKEGEIQSLRNNLLAFSLSAERESVIRREDRNKVIPVVIRILLSKLGRDREGPNRSGSFARASKKGNKALSSTVKRKVIISYLSELPEEETSLLLSVIIDPLVRVSVLLDEKSLNAERGREEDVSAKALLRDVLDGVPSSSVLEGAREVELKGYHKSFLLDKILSQDSAWGVSTFWVWEGSGLLEEESQSGDFGFAYSNEEGLLASGRGEDHRIHGSRRVRISTRRVDLGSAQYKVVSRFLSYLDHLFNFMSHTLRDHVHVILIMLTNILQLSHSEMVKTRNLGRGEELERDETVLREESPRLPDENKQGTDLDDVADDHFALQDKQGCLDSGDSSRQEALRSKAVLSRARTTCKQVFLSMSNIFGRYPQLSRQWIYLVRPVSSILLSSFETSLRSSANLHLSSIVNLMVGLSREEALLEVYSSLFPSVLLDLSKFLSDKSVISGISNGVVSGGGRSSSELVVSTMVGMYLDILFGGQERFSVFLEALRGKGLMMTSCSETAIVAVDFSQLEEGRERGSVVSEPGDGIVVSRRGLELVSGCAGSIIDSLQKIIFARNLRRTSHKLEIITFKELILLKTLALAWMSGESSVSGAVAIHETTGEESSSLDSNMVKIVLLLLMSTMDKLHSTNERVQSHNLSVFSLISSMVRLLDLEVDDRTRPTSRSDSRYSKEGLMERIKLLVTADAEKRREDFSYSFLTLLSDVMSYLLLRTPTLGLRGTVSEILLFSELTLSGKRTCFSTVLDSLDAEEETRSGFGLRSFMDRHGELLQGGSGPVGNWGLLVPVAICGLNRPGGKKRRLDSSEELDVQLDILRDLEDILDLDGGGLAILEGDLRLLYPLVAQNLYYIGGSGSTGPGFSASSMSLRFMRKLVVSWCGLISRVLEDQSEADHETEEFTIECILHLLLGLVVPFEEEVIRRSQDLQAKRSVLKLVEVVVEHFTPLLDVSSSRMRGGVSRDLLVDRFHLSLFPVLGYVSAEEGGEEVRLLEELTHIQKHRRARSLNFLARFARFSLEQFGGRRGPEEGRPGGEAGVFYLGRHEVRIPVSPYTIRVIGVPLALDSLLQRGSGKETYSLSLGDNSLRSIEAFALFFDWRYCIDLTGYLIKLLRLTPQRKTYIIKAICSLLNSFDFQVDQLVVGTCSVPDEGQMQEEARPSASLGEQLSEMQTSIKQRLLPLLRSIMVDRSYRLAGSKSDQISAEGGVSTASSVQYGLIRSDIVLIIIRVLRCLPSKEFHSELPRLLTQLIMALKSRDREVRRSSRSSLKSISKTLGVQYLSWILTQMSSILTLGYQLPVLIFTAHSILHEISASASAVREGSAGETPKTVVLDDSVQILGTMVVEELNRIADPDRRSASLDTIDTPATGSVDEGKYVRSPQIIRILSRHVSLRGAERLFEFLEDLMSGKLGDRGEASIISDSFSQKYLYWLKNLHFQFCIGFLSNDNFGSNTKLKFSVYNLARGVVLNKNMMRDGEIRVLISSMSKKILSLFQDPLGLLRGGGILWTPSAGESASPPADRPSRKERYYKVQPGASTGRGTHQVVKRHKGFEGKVRAVVLSSSCLYLLSQLLKRVSNLGLSEMISEDDSTLYLPMDLLLDHLLPLVAINFASESNELASFSCKCIIRVLFLESMESVRSLGVLEIDHLGLLISRTALGIMERSGTNSINTSNSMADLISSSMKLFAALLIRPKSASWFDGLLFGQGSRKTTVFYTNLLKQLHITINDNRLRVTSLQLLRQVILYGKQHVTLSSDSLGSLYSLVDSVLPLIVQYSSMEPRIVSLGCNIYVDLLLFYPMSEGSQRRRISVLLENLPEYPTSEGRQALLTAIHTLVTRFPVRLITESYNIMFLTGLALALSVETESKPRSMIRGIVFEILCMYRNDNQARVGLVLQVFRALGTLGSNLNIKCGLVVMLEFILEFFISRGDVVSLKEIGDVEGLVFSELSQLVSALSAAGLEDLDGAGSLKDTGSSKRSDSDSIMFRLEYETINLVNLCLEGEFAVFKMINLAWFSRDKLENRRIWSQLWSLLVIDGRNCRGLESGHLWVRSSLYRAVGNLLRQCLTGVAMRSKGECEGLFLLDFTLNPKIFTSLFNRMVTLQFSSILEAAPWLVPKVLACVQHLVLLSDFLREDWTPPRKLSEMSGEGQKQEEESIFEASTVSIYNLEPKKGTKRIKISKENEVQEEDWLVIDDGRSGEGEEEDGADSGGDSLPSLEASGRPGGLGAFGENDDTEEALDSFLLDRIREGDGDDGFGHRDGGSSTVLMEEEDQGLEAVDWSRSPVSPEERSGGHQSTIRKEVFWWLIDRISCCSRFYSTRPGTFRVRLLLSIRSLHDMVGFLPAIVGKGQGGTGHGRCDWDDSRTHSSLKHALRALYQSSTMLGGQDFAEKGGFPVHNIGSFDWIRDVDKFGVYQVVGQACQFSQRTVERWDKVFNEIGETRMFLDSLSEARRSVLSGRMERKARLKLDAVRNPELAFKRRKATRERVRENRKRKLRAKVENRKLNRV